MYNFHDILKQKLSQKILLIPERGVGLIPNIISPLNIKNVKKVAMKLLYV